LSPGRPKQADESWLMRFSTIRRDFSTHLPAEKEPTKPFPSSPPQRNAASAYLPAQCYATSILEQIGESQPYTPKTRGVWMFFQDDGDYNRPNDRHPGAAERDLYGRIIRGNRLVSRSANPIGGVTAGGYLSGLRDKTGIGATWILRLAHHGTRPSQEAKIILRPVSTIS